MRTNAGVLQFDSKRFRQVLGHYPTGVTVVTAVDGDEQAGRDGGWLVYQCLA